MSDLRCSYDDCPGYAGDKLLCIDHWMELPLFLRMAWLTSGDDERRRAAAVQAIHDHLDEARLLKDLGF